MTSTVMEFKQEDDVSKEVLVKVAYRIYKEDGYAVDKVGLKYDGFDETQDEWIPMSDMKLQALNFFEKQDDHFVFSSSPDIDETLDYIF